MAEGQSPVEITESTPKLSRREAIKGGIKRAVGALALGALLGRETKVIKEGLDTPNGTFFPLYERHDVGQNAADLPTNLDLFFKEGRIEDHSVYREEPGFLLNSFADRSPQVFQRLALDNTKILFGDVNSAQKKGSLEDALKRTQIGTIIAGSGILYEAVKESIGKLNPPKEPVISRRGFLKKALFGAGTAVAAPGVAEIAGTSLLGAGMQVEQKNAIQRIYLRLNGLVTGHLRPEEHILFFRNILMSDKLLAVAEDFQQKSGKKGRIGFNVGAAHAGMEDFLVVGHDFTSWLISQYPNDLLWDFVESNGTLEEFCSIRSLSLPREIPLNSSGQLQVEELNQTVGDEMIVDQKLFEMLQIKLHKEQGQAKQKDIEQRKKDIGSLKDILGRHLSPEMQVKMDRVLENFYTLKSPQYDELFRVEKSISETGEEHVFYDVTLPSGARNFNRVPKADISVRIRKDNGKITQEFISLYTDKKGDISPVNEDLDTILIPEEDLQPTINGIFPDSPKEGWTYTAAGSQGGIPKPAQGYLRNTSYQISQDGRLEARILPAN